METKTQLTDIKEVQNVTVDTGQNPPSHPTDISYEDLRKLIDTCKNTTSSSQQSTLTNQDTRMEKELRNLQLYNRPGFSDPLGMANRRTRTPSLSKLKVIYDAARDIMNEELEGYYKQKIGSLDESQLCHSDSNA